MWALKVKEWTAKNPAQISEDLPLEAHQEKRKKDDTAKRGRMKRRVRMAMGLAMESGRKRGDEGGWDFWGGLAVAGLGRLARQRRPVAKLNALGPCRVSPGMCLSTTSKRRGYMGPGLYSVLIRWPCGLP